MIYVFCYRGIHFTLICFKSMLHLFVCVLYNNPAVSEYMIILFLARKVIIRIFIHEKSLTLHIAVAEYGKIIYLINY